MKTKVSLVLKHVLSLLSSIAKSKSASIKNKTSAAKSRILMFSFMQQKLISNKIHNLLNHKNTDTDDDDDDEDQSKAIVLYNNKAASVVMSGECADSTSYVMEKNDSNNGIWDFLDEAADPDKSVIDLVKDSKEGAPEDFKLEDEIDEVADLFIKRFHKQIRLQKLESFKRFQDMLERGL